MSIIDRMSPLGTQFKIIAGAFLAGLFGILLVIGFLAPLRKRTRPLIPRFIVNAIFSILSFAAGLAAVAPVAFAIMVWERSSHVGLLNWIPLPPWLSFVGGFLLLDLSFYYWHRLNHEVPLLWRFHNVHHVDPDVDVTTSFRFHIVEVLYSSAFRAVRVLIIGVAPLTYVIYEIVFQAGTMFHHSNARIPIGLERVLNKVVVTPRMHGIHHSAMRSETNSNYSVVFRWWDWLHRSLHLNVKHADITIGVPAYREMPDNRFWKLMAMPFTKQREYWRWPSGEISIARTREADKDRTRLSE
jgi:sterol desaturase/sphingolipid hydroxylase (fatty acid hydroxylase superfamily)